MFTIKAEATGMAFHTTTITLTTYVHSIELSIIETPTMNFDFQITAELFAEDGTEYTESVTVELSESTGCLEGSLSESASLGTAAFTVYLTSIAQKTIQANCAALSPFPEVTESILITALPLKLKYDSFTPVFST